MTTRFRAILYDGRTSARHDVDVRIGPDGVIVVSGGPSLVTAPFTEVTVSPRLGNTPRSLVLPGGEKLETHDNEAIDAVLRSHREPTGLDRVHWLESRWRNVLGALAITALAMFAIIEYGIPFAAKRVAYQVPLSMERALGEQGLETLDEVIFEASELDPSESYHLDLLFERALAWSGVDYPVRLVVRASPVIGPNAFALPSGIVVVTDELVRLMGDDEEALAAVIAHEIGHVEQRHIMRTLLQNSVVALFVAVVVGDVSSVAGLAAALPAVLMEARYSREFEREADAYAVEVMEANGVPRRALARALRRLQETHGGPDEEAGGLPDYLSSHPATSERLEALEGP